VAVRRGGCGRDLTPEQLEALLRSLDPDREKAGERYEEIRRRLIRLFEYRGCESPEDLADETINRVARQLAGELTLHSDPYAYFCGVARLLTLEKVRQDVRQRKVLDAQSWAAPAPEDEPDPRLDHLRHCLQQLSSAHQELLLRYHQGEQRIQDRKRICKDLRIEMNALRIRVHRLRRKIETCIQERLRS
jgi:DNA-directed RNA polymerase specialized sigma24 family protein